MGGVRNEVTAEDLHRRDLNLGTAAVQGLNHGVLGSGEGPLLTTRLRKQESKI